MRAGYDRVSSDTLIPPIPDFPVRPVVPANSDDSGFATAAIAAFLSILAVGMIVALHYTPPQMITSSVGIAPIELPRDTR